MRIRTPALRVDLAALTVLLLATGALLGSTTPGMRFVGIAVMLATLAQALRLAVRAAPALTALAREI